MKTALKGRDIEIQGNILEYRGLNTTMSRPLRANIDGVLFT
ncbi:MAG: hypothetical protein ACOYCD_00175 [Kiritimatiellia bacterium]|jgi:hypothetical protein